jgi:hypothetical protein
MIRESPAIPGLLMHSRPLNPKDDVMAKAIGAGLRKWAANNYRSSDTPPTPSAPTATDRDAVAIRPVLSSRSLWV